MLWLRTVVMIALLFASVITCVLACFAYQHRRQSGAIEFAALMITLTVYSFGYGFELSSNTLSQVLFWNKVEYMGIAFIPFFWMMLILRYIGVSKQVGTWLICLLAGLSIFALGANFTNGLHHQYYSDVSFQRGEPFPIITYTMGPLGVVYLIYLYGSLFGGNILLITALSRMAKLYHSQIYIIICGSLVTWLGSVIYLFELTPFQLDLSPFAFTITGLIFTWGVFRHKLFNLSPIARNIVFETMREGVLTLDLQNRIVDYNPAARNILEELTPGAIGRDIAVIIHNQEFINQIRNNLQCSEFYISQESQNRFINSQLSWILSAGTPVGKNIIFDDRTMEREAQIHLIHSEKLTVLGQLVSNVVHEMNTPLAAIKATAENIEDTFENLRFRMADHVDALNEDQKQLVWEIFQKNRVRNQSTGKEENENFIKLVSILKANQLVEAEDIARSFVKLGIDECYEQFLPMIQNEAGRIHLKFIVKLAIQRQKIAELLTEEEKTAKIVNTLRKHSHPSG